LRLNIKPLRVPSAGITNQKVKITNKRRPESCSNVNSTEGRKERPFWQIDCTIKEQGKNLHILVLLSHKWMLRLLVEEGEGGRTIGMGVWRRKERKNSTDGTPTYGRMER
jgi:hypothetical protein